MQFIQIIANLILLIQFVLGNDSSQHSFYIPTIQSSEKQRRVGGISLMASKHSWNIFCHAYMPLLCTEQVSGRLWQGPWWYGK